MKNIKYVNGQNVEVKILNQWHPACVEFDAGGGWYMCNIGIRCDMFTANNMRPAKV